MGECGNTTIVIIILDRWVSAPPGSVQSQITYKRMSGYWICVESSNIK